MAGALNTTGFYAVGLYSSNMTGNVSALAERLSLARLAEAGAYLALVAAFVAGAGASALLVNAGRRRGLRGIHAFCLMTEAALLAGLGGAELWLPDWRRGLAGLCGLAFAMGLQNATVTRISDGRVRTTHVTGMVTDLGIELGNLLDPEFRGDGPEAALNRTRLRLHGQTVLSFLAGGIAGVAAYRACGAVLLLGAAAALLLLLALPGALAAGPLTPSPRR